MGRKKLIRIVCAVVLLAALPLSYTALAKGPGGTKGNYNLDFRGCYSGKGSAKVNPHYVNISGNLTDDYGNPVDFDLSHMVIQSNYRFSGTTTVNGLKVDLTGRIDPPDDDTPVARLVCTFKVASGDYGRIIGSK